MLQHLGRTQPVATSMVMDSQSDIILVRKSLRGSVTFRNGVYVKTGADYFGAGFLCKLKEFLFLLFVIAEGAYPDGNYFYSVLLV